ncbi:MAG: hypothetical protein RID09_15640 [Coleofasciculus sp. G1-WW12-02]|uniref:hypothetical protein n=1 Tax=Coleofasciculus sp. G1-WW12-02 TaxID=3068483 RepID=UPI0032FBCEF6
MSQLDQIISLIKSSPLTDIITVGFIDHDNDIDVKMFNIIQTELYLEFEPYFIRCSSINQYDKLKMEVVDKIVFDFKIEEGDEYCISSISDMYLFDPYGTNEITSIEFLLDQEIDIDEGVFKCVQLNIGSKDKIFLDPTHTFGIKINGKSSFIEWIDNKIAQPNYSSYSKLVWDKINNKSVINRLFPEG